MERIASLVTLTLLVAAGALLAWTMVNLRAAGARRLGIAKVRQDLAALEKSASELDHLRKTVAAKSAALAPLAALSEKRVAWAPKLAVLGASLPANTTIHKLDASIEGLFGPVSTRVARTDKAAAPLSVRELNFSLIHVPDGGDSSDPMGQLLERLRASPAFMSKMDSTRLEASEQGVWDGQSVLFFRGLLQGETKTP